MEKKIVKVSLCAILVFGIILSCRKEIAEILDNGATGIKEARTWYESNYSPGVNLKFADIKGGLKAKPDWKHAYTSSHEGFKTVEVPLTTKGRFGFTDQECREAFKQTGDHRYMRSLTCMVVVLEKGDQKTTGFLMTLIPGKDYRDAERFDAFRSK
jgi:hypothetical protein